MKLLSRHRANYVAIKRILSVLLLVLAGLVGPAPTTHATFPGVTGKIAVSKYVGDGDEKQGDIWILTPDGTAKKKLGAERGEYDPAWSPDGRRLAFARQGSIMVVDANGKNERGVAYGSNDPLVYPEWSPDASRLVYVRWVFGAEGNVTHSSIEAMKPNGSGSVVLLEEDAWYLQPEWSPDGKHVVFFHLQGDGDLDPAGSSDVLIMDADGSDVQILTDGVTPGFDAAPSWTPDGRILFTSGRDCGPRPTTYRCSDVYVMDRDGTNVEALTDCPCDFNGDLEPDGFREARISPDGQQLSLLLTFINDDEQGESEHAIWIWDLAEGNTYELVTDVFGSPAEWQPTCTVRGTPKRDFLEGTPGRDLICGLGGADHIKGMGGDDVIFAHGGADDIGGGAGHDILVGGPGRDRCGSDKKDFSVIC